MFEIRLTDDSRMTVRAAAVVRWVKAIDPYRPHATLSELIEHGTSHAANSQHDNIEMLHIEKTGAVKFPSTEL
jgi:hypothetical protein